MKANRIVILAGTAAFGAACWSMGPSADSAATPDRTISTASSATPRPSATPSANTKMRESSKDKPFLANLPVDFVQPGDDSSRLLLREYGSLFVAHGVTVPRKIVFVDDSDVANFQSTAGSTTETIGGIKVQLQKPAMQALKDAAVEANAAGLSIGPRGEDSSRRGYQQTVSLWKSRVDPGFAYWVAKGRVTAAEGARIKALSPYEQVPEILNLEQQGIFFAKDLSKSIIYSVAPPGTSQHLSMLALDVKEFENASVREILARHGWFQTVSSDLPHFTYLGVAESELPGLGLKSVTNTGRSFWVPDL
jgi:hypothetical protein